MLITLINLMNSHPETGQLNLITVTLRLCTTLQPVPSSPLLGITEATYVQVKRPVRHVLMPFLGKTPKARGLWCKEVGALSISEKYCP